MLYANRYQLVTEIGKGSMGTVYAAQDLLTRNLVALKVVTTPPVQLSIRHSSGPQLDLFLALAHEFRILASLRHSHIISVLDYGFDQNHRPFFTMDLLENPLTILQAGWMQGRATKIQLLIEVLQALAYLHRRGVVHRDLKPSNILVADGQVRVLDFGLAIERGEMPNIAGTLAYIAPELLHNQVPTTSSDLYAVGVIAYELFVGQHPFDLSTTNTLLRDIFLRQPDLALLEAAEMAGDCTLSYEGEQRIHSTLNDLMPIPDPDLVMAQDIDGMWQGGDFKSPLTGIVKRLLEKDPSQRYTEAEHVIRDLRALLDVSTATETPDLRKSYLEAAKFVGRERELAPLLEALESIKRPHFVGSAWVISGESGVGKSRLIDELRIRALVDGVVVLRGQGASGSELPFQLWRSPLQRLVLSSRISDDAAVLLKQIVPDIEQLIGRKVSEMGQVGGDNLRQRLIDTILNVFARQEAPTLLLLEDLQWAQASLEPLQRLAQMVGELPLLIVATCRHDEAPYLPDMFDGIQVIKLQRFSEDEIAELSHVMLGEVGRNQAILNFLQHETEGNAFFVVEVIRALAENADYLSDIDPTMLPETVFTGDIRDLIQRRLKRVPEWGQALLKLAAIQGRIIDYDVMQAIIAGGNGQIDDLEAWLLACGDAVVLEIHETQWRFCHDKFREYLIASITSDERRELYRVVAEAVELVYGDHAAYQANLAELWSVAGDAERECRYAQLAGQHAMELSAYADAIRHFQRVRELIGGDVDERPELEQSARLEWRLGRSYYHIGDYDAAQFHYESSLAFYETLDNLLGMAESLEGLGWIGLYKGDFEMAMAFFTNSLDLFKRMEHQAGIARLYNGLGDIARNQGDFSSAEVYHQNSLAIERKRNNAYGIAFSLHFLGMVERSRGNYEAAHEYFSESLALRRELGDRAKIGISLANLGVVALRQGRYQVAKRQFVECLSMFEAVANRQGISVLSAFLADAELKLGEGEEAMSHLNQAVALAMQIGSMPAMLRAVLVHARMQFAKEDAKRGLELLGLVLHHPDTDADVKSDALESLDEFRGRFSEGMVEECIARGALLEPKDVLAAWLGQH